MKRRPSPRLLVATAGLLLTASASAHTGTDAGTHHGLLAGFLHPFGGIDHLLAMLAVGFAAAARTDRHWLAPACFAIALLAGAVAGAFGLMPPAIEPMVAASLLVIGLATAARARPAAGMLAALCAGFGVFHGAAHASELTGSAALIGMLGGSALLMLCGRGLGNLARRGRESLTRLAGALTALTGLALVAATLVRH